MITIFLILINHLWFLERVCAAEMLNEHNGHGADPPRHPRFSNDSRTFECVDFYLVPRIPLSYRENISSWFTIVEKSFKQARITDQIKQAHSLITASDPDIILHIIDLLALDPPSRQLYLLVEGRLISTFCYPRKRDFVNS